MATCTTLQRSAAGIQLKALNISIFVRVVRFLRRFHVPCAHSSVNLTMNSDRPVPGQRSQPPCGSGLQQADHSECQVVQLWSQRAHHSSLEVLGCYASVCQTFERIKSLSQSKRMTPHCAHPAFLPGQHARVTHFKKRSDRFGPRHLTSLQDMALVCRKGPRLPHGQ